MVAAKSSPKSSTTVGTPCLRRAPPIPRFERSAQCLAPVCLSARNPSATSRRCCQLVSITMLLPSRPCRSIKRRAISRPCRSRRGRRRREVKILRNQLVGRDWFADLHKGAFAAESKLQSIAWLGIRELLSSEEVSSQRQCSERKNRFVAPPSRRRRGSKMVRVRVTVTPTAMFIRTEPQLSGPHRGSVRACDRLWISLIFPATGTARVSHQALCERVGCDGPDANKRHHRGSAENDIFLRGLDTPCSFRPTIVQRICTACWATSPRAASNIRSNSQFEFRAGVGRKPGNDQSGGDRRHPPNLRSSNRRGRQIRAWNAIGRNALLFVLRRRRHPVYTQSRSTS